ncbi:hypothetical protein [Larkinella soli]|uniref:hypothetical protein n=1 Tax=Larkinella soli TaxID=1770527 RepID=UPI000FFBEF75|nr:hypothetical protein [Larkinella soli]
MNPLRTLYFGFALLVSLSSCKHEVDPVSPEQPNVPSEQPQKRPGKVYPVGSPQGAAVTATIGPAGGQLTSADDRLTIIVPAGAVDAAQTFSIQPIGSTGPQSLGNAFRLSPHGTTFKKPVTIRFRYNPAMLTGSVAEALAPAYQNDKGVWTLAAKGKVDKAAQAVTVETTHFSDWALLERAKLLPEIGFVKPGEDIGLEVIVLNDEILVPMVKDTEIPEPYVSPADLIDASTWKLAGSGNLTPDNWKARYVAPNALPAVNPVAVSVKLKAPTSIDGQTFGELQLVSNLYIGSEGLTFRINGGKWITTLATGRLLTQQGIRYLDMAAGVTQEGNNWGVNIQTYQPPVETDENLALTYTSMTMPWSLEPTSPLFHLTDEKGKVYYKHFYAVPPVFIPSPGALTFYRFGKKGDYIIGKFEMEKAGVYNDTRGYLGTARIEGFFRMKRAL